MMAAGLSVLELRERDCRGRCYLAASVVLRQVDRLIVVVNGEALDRDDAQGSSKARARLAAHQRWNASPAFDSDAPTSTLIPARPSRPVGT